MKLYSIFKKKKKSKTFELKNETPLTVKLLFETILRLPDNWETIEVDKKAYFEAAKYFQHNSFYPAIIPRNECMIPGTCVRMLIHGEPLLTAEEKAEIKRELERQELLSAIRSIGTHSRR
jgi:hypothetical protein